MIRTAHAGAWLSLVGLIVLCALWETVAAPMRPGGSLLVLKVLPLLAPLFGILRENLYTYRWASMLALAYFTEGVVRAWTDTGMARSLATVEIALTLVFFASCLAYVRSRQRASSAA
ncbi:MAG: DUF2069 domain-containing protein [Burkholderiales bacterium]